jgi:hypothetical protein
MARESFDKAVKKYREACDECINSCWECDNEQSLKVDTKSLASQLAKENYKLLAEAEML